MSKKAILDIRRAETEAEAMRKAAEEKAAEMRNAVEKQGAAHCDEVVRVTEEEYHARLEEIRARAAALIEQHRTEAESEAAAIKAAAEAHMSEAVKTIVWRIVEKCQ